MRMPLSPPPFEELIAEAANKSPDRLPEILRARIQPEPNGNYDHWDKLRHLKSPPKGLTNEEWWLGIKWARQALHQTIPHTAIDGSNFVFCETSSVHRLLHEIDMHGGGELTNTQVANPSSRDRYLINSLIEEAITSSQLEGAATTRKVAKEMLREKRRPRDRSERMILNNYHAMEHLKEISNQDLTPELILELQAILTTDTMDNADAVGAWRENDEIYVGDARDASILFVPPTYKEIPKRMESLCAFANDSNPGEFLHPVIRAALLHFMLAYDHPFEDGNGRTARALFYWSMLRQNYWAMEFVSISRILKKAPAKYMRSYLYTETDDNDVTYFLLHQLQAIMRAIEDLLEYLRKKSEEHRKIEGIFRKSVELNNTLNQRQLAALNRAVKRPESTFTVQSHRGSHRITYETARTDLLKLYDLGLFEKSKRGNAFVFFPAQDLKGKLKQLE